MLGVVPVGVVAGVVAAVAGMVLCKRLSHAYAVAYGTMDLWLGILASSVPRPQCQMPTVQCAHCSADHLSSLCPKGPGGTQRDALTQGARNLLDQVSSGCSKSSQRKCECNRRSQGDLDSGQLTP